MGLQSALQYLHVSSLCGCMLRLHHTVDVPSHNVFRHSEPRVVIQEHDTALYAVLTLEAKRIYCVVCQCYCRLAGVTVVRNLGENELRLYPVGFLRTLNNRSQKLMRKVFGLITYLMRVSSVRRRASKVRNRNRQNYTKAHRVKLCGPWITQRFPVVVGFHINIHLYSPKSVACDIYRK